MVISTELSISVIIPVHNGGESFRRCLSSLEESAISPDEIIVVSDADTDGFLVGSARIWCESN